VEGVGPKETAYTHCLNIPIGDSVYLVLSRPLETLVRPLAGYAWVVGVLAS
jgi:hypothetical protein